MGKENRILKGGMSAALPGGMDPGAMRRYAIYPERIWFVEAFDETALAACYAGAPPVSGAGLADCVGMEHAPIAVSVTVPALASGNAAYLALARRIDDDIAFHCQWDAARADVVEMHWSGEISMLGASGTARLVALLRQRFAFVRDACWSVALDWRAAHDQMLLDTLVLSGFTHIELLGTTGLSGLPVGGARPWLTPSGGGEPADAEDCRLPKLVALARTHGFASVSAMLGYGGYPRAALSGPSSADTLDALVSAGATRIRLQARSSRADTLGERVALIGRLNAAGYVQLGIDDYAHRDDRLVSAQRFGRLICKPFGLSARVTRAVVPLGPGAFGATADAYFQHLEEVTPGVARPVTGGRKIRAPGLRGWRLSGDDAIRRTVIQSLATNFFIDRQAIELAHNIEFADYFANELHVLRRCANDGWLSMQDNFIEATEAGRVRLGDLCGIFDRYCHVRHTWLRSLAGAAHIPDSLLATR